MSRRLLAALALQGLAITNLPASDCFCLTDADDRVYFDCVE